MESVIPGFVQRWLRWTHAVRRITPHAHYAEYFPCSIDDLKPDQIGPVIFILWQFQEISTAHDHPPALQRNRSLAFGAFSELRNQAVAARFCVQFRNPGACPRIYCAGAVLRRAKRALFDKLPALGREERATA